MKIRTLVLDRRGGLPQIREPQAFQEVLHVLLAVEHLILASEQASYEVRGKVTKGGRLLGRTCKVSRAGTTGDHDRAPDRCPGLRLDRELGPVHGV